MYMCKIFGVPTKTLGSALSKNNTWASAPMRGNSRTKLRFVHSAQFIDVICNGESVQLQDSEFKISLSLVASEIWLGLMWIPGEA
jgi:hypothetical protein